MAFKDEKPYFLEGDSLKNLTFMGILTKDQCGRGLPRKGAWTVC